MGELPPKLFFRIGEVAGLVGVEPHVLRYWEREFRSIRPTKSAKGQRVYSRKDVENLLRVRDLLYRDGFTIAGAKKKLQRNGDETDVASDAEIADVTTEVHEVVDAGTELAQLPLLDELRTPELALNGGTLPAQSPRVREKLVALRQEIEAFIVELSPPARR